MASKEEEQIKAIVASMVAEDLAAGRPAPSKAALDVWHDNVATRVYGRSLDDSEKFWLSGDGGEKRGVKTKEVSFREAIDPFYDDGLEREVLSARKYARENLLGDKAPTGGPLAGANFDRFLDEKRLDQKIPVLEIKNPDSSQPARAEYRSVGDMVVMGEDFKYSTGKPIVMSHSGGKVTTIPNPGSTYDNVFQHEMGHSIFDAKILGGNTKAMGPAYYDNPVELITELAHAQRQQFKKTGKRFDEKSFIEFMGRAGKDPKLLDGFAPNTKNALKNLLNHENKDSYIKQAARVIPALVRNDDVRSDLEEIGNYQPPPEPDYKTETLVMIRNYLSSLDELKGIG